MKLPKEAWRDFILPECNCWNKNQPTRWTKTKHTLCYCPIKLLRVYSTAGVLRKQIIIWDRFEAHLLNAGYPIKTDEGDVRTFASDTDGIGYDDEVFMKPRKIVLPDERMKALDQEIPVF